MADRPARPPRQSREAVVYYTMAAENNRIVVPTPEGSYTTADGSDSPIYIEWALVTDGTQHEFVPSARLAENPVAERSLRANAENKTRMVINLHKKPAKGPKVGLLEAVVSVLRYNSLAVDNTRLFPTYDAALAFAKGAVGKPPE